MSPQDLSELKDRLKAEDVAARLLDGQTARTIANITGMKVSEVNALATSPEVIELVAEDDPEMAAELKAQSRPSDDALSVLEAGAIQAAEKLVESLASEKANHINAKALLDMALKLRAARVDAPTKIEVSLPSTHAEPLLEACREFNELIANLNASPSPGDHVVGDA